MEPAVGPPRATAHTRAVQETGRRSGTDGSIVTGTPAGDEHARRQLASWLSDRARTEEAIEVIRPLADAGDDVAELWLARWLAERGQVDELRQRVGLCCRSGRAGTEAARCGPVPRLGWSRIWRRSQLALLGR